jgi:hypothetical protein
MLLTHDVRTITAHAYERVAAGMPMPGVIEVNRTAAVGKLAEELEGRVVYIPIR